METPRVPRLTSVTIDITNKCHLICPHCIISLPEREEGTRLEVNFLKSLIPKLIQYGCLEIRLTGGEPLLHPNFSEIYLMLKKMGFKVIIFTNGILLNNDLISFFNLYPPAQLIITLYGASDEDYKTLAFGKKAGIFTHLKETIMNLARSKINYKLQCWILKTSSDLYERLKEALGDSFKIAQAYYVYPRSSTDISNTECMLDLDKEKLYQTEKGQKRLDYKLERLMNKCNKGVNERKLLYNCGVGYSNIHITADRKILLCAFFRDKYFDLHKYSLDETITEKIPQLFEEKIPLGSKCYSCQDKSFCVQCVPLGFGTVGDNPLRDYLCREAKILKKYAQKNKKVDV